MTAKYTPDQIIDSAVALAQAILASGAIEPHKREFLSYCIWKVTEAEGKYAVRYWSEGVLALVQQYGSLAAVLKQPPPPVHEHVNTRKSLVDVMMKDPTCIARVLHEEALACLVTPSEHLRLGSNQVGFRRYQMASIRVWDTVNQDWITTE